MFFKLLLRKCNLLVHNMEAKDIMATVIHKPNFVNKADPQ